MPPRVINVTIYNTRTGEAISYYDDVSEAELLEIVAYNVRPNIRIEIEPYYS